MGGLLSLTSLAHTNRLAWLACEPKFQLSLPPSSGIIDIHHHIQVFYCCFVFKTDLGTPIQVLMRVQQAPYQLSCLPSSSGLFLTKLIMASSDLQFYVLWSYCQVST